MDLSARCLVLLSCLGVILAIDLDAIDPGYYVEPTATSETIDYKDPCKAGEIWFVIVFSFSCTVYDFLFKKKKHIYVEVKKKMPRLNVELAQSGQSNAFGEMTVVDVVFKRLEGTLCAIVL